MDTDGQLQQRKILCKFLGARAAATEEGCGAGDVPELELAERLAERVSGLATLAAAPRGLRGHAQRVVRQGRKVLLGAGKEAARRAALVPVRRSRRTAQAADQ